MVTKTKLKYEDLQLRVRAELAKHGVDGGFLDKERRTATWDELQENRATVRRVINELVADETSAPGVQHRDAVLGRLEIVDYLGDVVAGLSKEMDFRDSNGSREPGTNLAAAMGGVDPSAYRRDGAAGSGQRFVDLKTGAELRALGPKDSFASTLRGDYGRSSLTFGDFVAGAVTGRWRNPEHQAEARTMSIGVDAGGGYMVPAPLSSQFIDLARAQMQVQAAGATMIPMDTKTLDLARNAGDATAAWKAENAAASFSDMTLERVQLSCETVMAAIRLSNELFDDAPNIGQVIESSLSQAMALEMDRVCLEGSGTSPEPCGIYNAAGTLDIDNAEAALTDYDQFSRAVEQIRTQHHEPNAILLHPQTLGRLDRLKDTTDQPLQAPPSWQGLTKLPTAQISTTMLGSPSLLAAYIAKWSEMLIGVRREIKVEFSMVAASGSDSAFLQYQIWVRAVARMDVQLMRPRAFCTIKRLPA
ncbi:MAG: phage major capsid protein [Alphaproteobacteria bacterium]